MKKIIIGIGSRANFGSIKAFLETSKLQKKFEVKALCYGTSILEKYGNVSNAISDIIGVEKVIKISTHIEGEDLGAMSRTVSQTLLQTSNIFENEKPDYVLTVGDRYETTGFALAAALQNIRIIHTMGGEVTGTIDESLRHSITKLSHIHFVASEDAKERLNKLGEDPKYIFNTGCPRLDEVNIALSDDPEFTQQELDFFEKQGVGKDFSPKEPFILVSFHPVTTEYSGAFRQTSELIESLAKLKYNIVFLWPNSDAGSEKVTNAIRKAREHEYAKNIKFFKNFPVRMYYKLMSHTVCMIGNSSSGIREGAFIGTPVVNIGTRQLMRERGPNVIDVDNEKENITNAIMSSIGKKCLKSNIYGDGNSAKEMWRILTAEPLPNIQKLITY